MFPAIFFLMLFKRQTILHRTKCCYYHHNYVFWNKVHLLELVKHALYHLFEDLVIYTQHIGALLVRFPMGLNDAKKEVMKGKMMQCRQYEGEIQLRNRLRQVVKVHRNRQKCEP